MASPSARLSLVIKSDKDISLNPGSVCLEGKTLDSTVFLTGFQPSASSLVYSHMFPLILAAILFSTLKTNPSSDISCDAHVKRDSLIDIYFLKQAQKWKLGGTAGLHINGRSVGKPGARFR